MSEAAFLRLRLLLRLRPQLPPPPPPPRLRLRLRLVVVLLLLLKRIAARLTLRRWWRRRRRRRRRAVANAVTPPRRVGRIEGAPRGVAVVGSRALVVLHTVVGEREDAGGALGNRAASCAWCGALCIDAEPEGRGQEDDHRVHGSPGQSVSELERGTVQSPPRAAAAAAATARLRVLLVAVRQRR